jgi:hypothetical protein
MTTSETSGMISGKNAERTVEVQGIVAHLFEGGRLPSLPCSIYTAPTWATSGWSTIIC